MLNKRLESMIMNIKSVMYYFLIVVASFILCSCGIEAVVDDIVDQGANIVQADDEHVLFVKGGTNPNYPEVTYEEAFEDFFSLPTWKYFKGTKQGQDDDGDGVSDYTEDNVDVVEFTGTCLYQDVEVKALIQFTLDTDNGTFEATYLSFNEVPQSTLILLALLNTVFESYVENHGVSSTSNTTTAKIDDSQNTNSTFTQSSTSDVTLITSSAKATATAFVGSWDNGTGKYSYEITDNGDGTFTMNSFERRSGVEFAEGVYTGVYDSSTGIMTFTGTVDVGVFSYDDDSAAADVTTEYDTMRFKMGSSGRLQQEDSGGWSDWLIRTEELDDYISDSSGDWSYMIEGSDYRYLDRAELAYFTMEELRIARNEIYARHGRMFNDSSLQNYFNSKAWYYPTIPASSFDESVLNQYEKANINLIKDVEANGV